MNFAEELKNSNDEGFNRWFERWFENKDIPNLLRRSAARGYSAFSIELKEYCPMTIEEKYLNNRLRDIRTIKKLEEKLPGIDVKLEVKQGKNLFGLPYKNEKLVFSWKVE